MDDSVIDVESETAARLLLAAASESIPADAELLGPGLLHEVRRRTCRQARTRALLAAGVAAGTALAVATAAAPPALAAVLSSAAAKTSTQTYHVKTLTTMELRDQSGTHTLRTLVTGEFDPAHHAYAEQGTPIPYRVGHNVAIFTFPTVRVVGGYSYLRTGSRQRPWIRENGQTAEYLPVPTRQSQPAPLDQQVNLAQADPQDLLAMLRSVAAVHPDGAVSGAGWTGTRYTFTATGSAPGYGAGTMTGTVDVDQQGRVRHLAVFFTPTTAPAAVTSTRTTVDVTFSAFGARVSISPPPAGQVIDISDLPVAHTAPTPGASPSEHNR
jgi:hypothetical protein